MTARRLLAGTAVAFAAACGPAAAAGVRVDLDGGARWPERRLQLQLGHPQRLTAADLRVTENGRGVSDLRVRSRSADPRRGIVLAIDASRSMRGRPIESALLAARRLADHRARTSPLGVVFFAGGSRLALAPTTDRAKIARALAVGPELTSGSDITGAAATSVKALRAAGMTSGSVVVLSDGAATRSPVSLDDVRRLATRADVRVYTVGLRSATAEARELAAMAAQTGGRYAAAGADLPAVFTALGDQLAAEYVVTYGSPVRAGQPVRLRVRAPGGTAALRYRAPAVGPARLREAPTAGPAGLDGAHIALIALLTFLVLAGLGWVLVGVRTRTVTARVADYAGAGRPADAAAARPVVQRPERPRSPRSVRSAETLAHAGVPWSPRAVQGTVWSVTALLAVYIARGTGHPLLAVFAGAVPLGVRMVLAARVRRRERAFEDQLPDNLQLLASSLRSGHSFSGALAAVAADAPEPSRTEFRRASQDEQLGVDIAKALEAVSERMRSPEMQYVGVVARMQRETGGNTAETLDHVIETVRERLRLRRTVRVLTAQSRLGGGIISVMPIGVGVGLAVLRPHYFDPMFASSIGVPLLVAGGLMLGAGWLIIRKIVDLET